MYILGLVYLGTLVPACYLFVGILTNISVQVHKPRRSCNLYIFTLSWLLFGGRSHYAQNDVVQSLSADTTGFFSCHSCVTSAIASEGLKQSR